MFPMKGGEGEYSYSQNNKFQMKVILKGKGIIEESVAEICKKKPFEECLRMVDLGCSSGPTTMVPLWEIIESVDSVCTKLNKKPPEIQYFLNDLSGNDYNTIFRSFVSDFHTKLEREKGKLFGHCFIAAMPGNFYERLFPSNSLHFVYSSNSLHWASRVPREAFELDKGSICIAESSPESVRRVYKELFEMDFTKFLRSRSVEVVSGGHMVFTFLLQTRQNPGCKIFGLLGDSLTEMVNEGMVEESIAERFKIPYNAPYIEDVTSAIEKESSFKIKKIKEFEIRWDANIEENENEEKIFDKWERGKFVGNYMRAVSEGLVSAHFGDAIHLHHLYNRYFSKLVDSLDNGTGLFNYLIISIIRK